MSTHHSLAAAFVAAACIATVGCGPLWLDERPQIRGTLETVDGSSVGIRHKTGRTYQVEVTSETRIVNRRQSGNVTLCPGQRATVFLAESQRFTATSITLWGGRCR